MDGPRTDSALSLPILTVAGSVLEVSQMNYRAEIVRECIGMHKRSTTNSTLWHLTPCVGAEFDALVDWKSLVPSPFINGFQIGVRHRRPDECRSSRWLGGEAKLLEFRAAATLHGIQVEEDRQYPRSVWIA